MTRCFIKSNNFDQLQSTEQKEKQEKLSTYNKSYYQKNKTKLKLYQQIYNSIHKEENLDFLREYYNKVEKKKRVNWDMAMKTPISTRYKPPRKGMFDKGRKVTGCECKKGLVTVTFD